MSKPQPPVLARETNFLLETIIANVVFTVGGGIGCYIANTLPAFLAGGGLLVIVIYGGRFFTMLVRRSEVNGDYIIEDSSDDE